MNVATCVVTFNRLSYTQRTVASYLETCKPGNALVIVDNGSTDGTREWLETLGDPEVILNKGNLFPGAATNIGWAHLLELGYPAELLQRSDNDVEYLPGWQDHVEECFTAIPGLGQLGVLNLHEDFPDGQPLREHVEGGVIVNRAWRSVGGNSVIRRELWDTGVRWQPGAWSPGGFDEDKRMSLQVCAEGYFFANVIPPITNNISHGRYTDFPDYYNATAGLRGLDPATSV